MTCVAFDGTYIAADSRVTAGSFILDDNYFKLIKISAVYRSEKILCIAFIGNYDSLQSVIDDLKNEAPDDQIRMRIDKSSALWIVTERNLWEMSGSGIFKITTSTAATGSGGEIASSAMALGLSAKEAVKHACKFDIYCGGKVRVMQVRETKKLTRKQKKDIKEDDNLFREKGMLHLTMKPPKKRK